MTAHSPLLRAAFSLGILACLSATVRADADVVLKRELDTRSDVTCASETAFGNFVADALKKSHGVDVALVNCAIIRGNRTYAVGAAFAPTDVAAEVAADQSLAILELTGAQLLDTLEQAVAKLPAASNAFPQVAGLRMDVDVKKPAGTRVVKLTVNGAALDFARTYRVATTTALADGAEGYGLFKTAKRMDRPKVSIADDVSAYLQKTGVKDVKILGRIELLK